MEWFKITVVCFIVCVVGCSSMSRHEIQEFSEFLKKTSQLDEILKKGSDVDDEHDEAEAASDHAWEESGKFEGDLILNDRQRRLLVEDVAEGLARNGLRDSTKRWPNNEVIYYIQREHFSGDQVQAIEAGIEDLAQASCVKFRPYRKGDRDAVVIQGSRRGCFSQVGYQSGYQVLNLSGRHPVGRGCFRHGTVVHELLHTLGFYHMQSSPDRDDYIDVVWENIVEPARHNFRKYNTFSVSDFGVGYDYDSVLHYSRRAFSVNGRDTLVPKQGGASIGQRRGLSDKDSQKLNKMYCDADSDHHNAPADEGDQQNVQKPIKKKKKPRNKPFEGHGIGYHQGKIVAIKLPAVETFKLPNLPTFRVFDDFSKTPQAVSPSVSVQGIGTGKEVEHMYKLPVITNIEEFRKQNTAIHQNMDSYSGIGPEKLKNEDDGKDKSLNKSHSEVVSKEVNVSNIPIQEEPLKDPVKIPVVTNESSESNGEDLSDDFDRLGKIIKTHVYPSHKPDFSIYKTSHGNVQYYKPEINIQDANQDDKHDHKVETLKITDQFKSIYAPSIKNYENDSAEKKSEKEKLIKEESQYDLSSEADWHKKYDSSNEIRDKEVTNEQDKFGSPEDESNYSSAEYQHKNTQPKPHDSLLGYAVPEEDDWYTKKTHDDYLEDSYYPSHPVSNDFDASESYHLSPHKEAYSLHGAFVPVAPKWYKLEADKHKNSFLSHLPSENR